MSKDKEISHLVWDDAAAGFPGNGKAVIRDLKETTATDWCNKAIALLARREHSAMEIKRKLEQRGADKADIDSVLFELKELSLQSDERFAQSYVTARIQAGFGSLRIRAELIQRGVTSDLIEKALQYDDDFWRDQLEFLWARRFRGKMPKNQQEYGRQVRFLLQRGFCARDVSSLIAIKK